MLLDIKKLSNKAKTPTSNGRGGWNLYSIQCIKPSGYLQGLSSINIDIGFEIIIPKNFIGLITDKYSNQPRIVNKIDSNVYVTCDDAVGKHVKEGECIAELYIVPVLPVSPNVHFHETDVV